MNDVRRLVGLACGLVSLIALLAPAVEKRVSGMSGITATSVAPRIIRRQRGVARRVGFIVEHLLTEIPIWRAGQAKIT